MRKPKEKSLTGMGLILATPLSIYYYDFGKNSTTKLMTGSGEYCGFTWDDKSIYVSHSNIDNIALKTEEDYRKSDQGYVLSYAGNGCQVAADKLSMVHQITIDQRGRLLVTNTGHNNIVVSEPDTGERSVRKLNDIDCEVIGDEKVGNHFNSLYEHENKIYVVAHNNGRKSSVWELDAATLEVIKEYDTGAEWAHNVWICEHGMIICDSKTGSLYEVYSGETLWKADEPEVITRGLAANDDYIFVGRSEYGNRFTRKWSDGGFWVLDRKTLKTVETVKLHKTGCTNEVRLVGSRDSCHNAPLLDPKMLRYINKCSIVDRLRSKVNYFKYKIKMIKERNK